MEQIEFCYEQLLKKAQESETVKTLPLVLYVTRLLKQVQLILNKPGTKRF